MKEVKKALYPNKKPSPPGSEETERNPPTHLEQRYERYESFDPSQPFAPYPSQTFDAPPPPLPKQPRPSMADQLVADIFGDPIPGMDSSSHTSFTHTTIPTYCHSSLYTVPRSHWAWPHDYASHDADDHQSRGIKLLWTLNFFFLGDC
jgi:hypothetical protein